MTDPSPRLPEAERQERTEHANDEQDLAIRRRTIGWCADAISASWFPTFLTAAIAPASLFTSGGDRARH
jgi:hypothetical protein